jgi:hypothetical protein
MTAIAMKYPGQRGGGSEEPGDRCSPVGDGHPELDVETGSRVQEVVAEHDGHGQAGRERGAVDRRLALKAVAVLHAQGNAGHAVGTVGGGHEEDPGAARSA